MALVSDLDAVSSTERSSPSRVSSVTRGKASRSPWRLSTVGRLGIAACSIGLAQAAFDEALKFTSEREQFGKPVTQNQGLQFMLADMSTQIEAGRQLYRHAARLRDAGQDY